MADEKNLDVGVRTRKEGTGFEDTSRAAKETKAAAEETTSSFKGLEEATEKANDALKEMAAAMGLLLGAAEVLEFLKEASEEFYKQEKAVRAVALAASAYGANVEHVKKEANEWSEAMSRLSGISNNELLRAVGEQYIVTGDLEQAYKRVSTAMDYAVSTGKTFDEGMRVVNATVHGQTRALVGAIPGVTRHMEAAQASAIAQKFLEEKVKGQTTAVHDNALEADKAKARWEMFKETIGGGVARAITGLRDGFILAKDAVILMGKELVEWFSTMGQSVAAFASFVKNVFTGSGSLTSEWKKYKEETARIDAEHAVRAKKIEDDAVKHYMNGLEEEVAAHKKAGETKLKLDLQLADNRLRVENTLAQQIAMRREHERLQYLKNQAFMQAEGEKAAREAILLMAKEDAIQEAYHAEAMKRAEQYQRTKRQLAKEELRMQKEVADAGLGLLTEVFGQSKELSIAQAVISTYEGATKALAQGGIYGAVLAAIVIAAGLAQVAKIESTEPATSGGISGGFDDPANDRMAYMTGRRWAKDVVDQLSGGWQEGLAGSRVSNTTHVDNSRRTTINANIQDPGNIESVKKLIRTIRMVDTNVLGQTSIAARTK
jgi:hypothetical protein